MKFKNAIVLMAALLSSCAASSSMRTSENELIIKTEAAPVCGNIGAMKVAEKQAAIETIKAGYDRYIILGQAGTDTTRVVQMPGSYTTTGTATVYGNTGYYSGNTVYNPGPTFVAGGHNQDLAVRMFKEGEPGSERALSARERLGPKWALIVRDGINTCAG
ncbi:hypothetical protein [Rhizobium chutanense]|uniref:DUF4156 domain-containing protein n=1 Tax=Rhizobium chutanense TaxID=2035448 RepID=A0A3S0SXP2_9HYPH|nr:hypothetical protein [Rhizobium chutanense]RUM06682.1 hypothetical protein EFR84_10750 [Rhizobium chutanense]